MDQRLDMETTLKVKREVMAHSSQLAPFIQLISSDTGGWYKLPGAGKVEGNLTEPEVSFKFEKATLDILKNAAGGFLKELLKQKPGTDSQPQASPPEKQPQENPIEDILKGIFKKKK